MSVKREHRTPSVPKDATCFECDDPATQMHHVVPYSSGGRRCIPMCDHCHGIIHGIKYHNHSESIKRALRKRKEKGLPIGAPKKRDDELICRLYYLGMSQRQISKTLGLSKTTAWRAIVNQKNIEFDDDTPVKLTYREISQLTGTCSWSIGDALKNYDKNITWNELRAEKIKEEDLKKQKKIEKLQEELRNLKNE